MAWKLLLFKYLHSWEHDTTTHTQYDNEMGLPLRAMTFEYLSIFGICLVEDDITTRNHRIAKWQNDIINPCVLSVCILCRTFCSVYYSLLMCDVPDVPCYEVSPFFQSKRLIPNRFISVLYTCVYIYPNVNTNDTYNSSYFLLHT